jgi:hypothetical protein
MLKITIMLSAADRSPDSRRKNIVRGVTVDIAVGDGNNKIQLYKC